MGLFSKKEKIDLHPEFSVTFSAGDIVLFDDNNRLVKTSFSQFSSKPKEYIKYDDILDLNVVDDNNIIKKSGVGAATTGALLFGPMGLIAGGVTRGKKKKEVTEKLHLNLILKDGTVKTIYFINSKTKHNSFIYKAIYPAFLSAGSKFEDILN